MSNQDFDVPKEPSVAAADPNERKLARRLRVQRRLEAFKKHEGARDDEAIVEITLTEKQIETSVEVLDKLLAEGDEVITNVRVANDARELQRRDEDVAVRNLLLKNLENEADESLKKYHEINEKWSGIVASKDPLDIHAGIKSQSAKCMEILEQKNIIISELKDELENADEKFFFDQKKQCEDVNLLIERIDNQVNTIAKAYRRELILIEDALDTERRNLLDNVTKRWDELYEQRHDEDANGIDRRKEIMREYEKEIRRVQIEHQEKYRAEKIQLETECQNLQLQVQRMKALCMINVEKLDYSYAVLKRREDENAIIKSQQKRRLNKLQDVVSSLKKNYNDTDENTRLEIQKLSEQVVKAHKNISELEAKSRHFTTVNEKQYFDVWDMNTKNANEILEKILNADKIIYEQTLGLDWEPPDLILLEKEDLPSYDKAITELRQRKAEIEATMKIFDPYRIPTNRRDVNLERRLLNHILKQISDNSGFLIEDRLRELLAPHTYHDNIIIRLDNVFQALDIKTEDQVDLLINFFLPYAYCVTCAAIDNNDSISSEIRVEVFGEEPPARKMSPNVSQCPDESFDVKDRRERNSLELSKVQRCELDLESSGECATSSNENTSEDTARNFESRITSMPEKFSEYTSPLPQRRVTCNKGHLLQIDSANVTRALKEFVQKYNAGKRSEVRSFDDKLINDRVALSRKLTTVDVTNYWNRYREIFSPKKEKLWDGLLIGLHKYHEILKERQKLNNETDCLKAQNDELRRLLETYTIHPDNPLMHLGPRSSNKTT